MTMRQTSERPPKRRAGGTLRTSTVGRWVLVLALPSAASACHHVVIDGGLEPTGERYDEEWNLAFAAAIYPAQVDASGQCGGYFSDVETRHSFLNTVVTAVTFGIISPMEVRMGCGVGPEDEGAEDGR